MDRHFAAKQRFPSFASDPADPDIVRRQLVPDRQEQSGCQVKPFALAACRRLIDLGLPQALELRQLDHLPAAFGELLGGRCALERADHLETRDARAIVGEQAARRDQQGDTAGPGVVHQAMPRGVEAKVFAEPFERQRLQSPGNLQLQQMRGRSGRGIGSQQRIGDDFEAFDRDRLNAKIEGAQLAVRHRPALQPGR
jgi:hypothetical protein